MQRAVTTLNDGRIGVLVDGRILQRKGVPPMGAVVAQCYRYGRAHTFWCQRQGLEIVVDERVATIRQRNGIRTALVVLDVEQGDGCPRVAVITNERGGQMGIVRTHEHLQAPVL